MFEKTGARHTIEKSVIVTLSGQEPMDAIVFIKIGERLSDLLNDPRGFIPIRKAEGSVIVAAKMNILSIEETFLEQQKEKTRRSEFRSENDEAPHHKQEQASQGRSGEEAPFEPFKPKKNFDPYDVLRILRGASVDEVRKAYKERIKSVHPDTIAAMDLDPELLRAANLKAQKVNHAYQMIMREFKDATAKTADFV